MTTMNREQLSGWKAVLAAVMYLATFIATCYALYGLTHHAPFIDSFLSAYPRALIVGFVIYGCSAAIESLHHALSPASKLQHPQADSVNA